MCNTKCKQRSISLLLFFIMSSAVTSLTTFLAYRNRSRINAMSLRQTMNGTHATTVTLHCNSDDPEVTVHGAPDQAVTVLKQSEHFLVVAKPPSVICHHNGWSKPKKRVDDGSGGELETEVPMLQRVRDAHGGRHVNLVHRLDRGASGCLLMAFADQEDDSAAQNSTSSLHAAMADKVNCTKTYVALVRGEGILRERVFKEEGWFLEDRPIKNESGVEKQARTWFRFVAGQNNDNGRHPEKARASLVLARPETGRWHQIRKHLNGLSHPILGDSSHGDRRVNTEWKKTRGLLPERICLHLSRLQIPPTAIFCPDGIDVTCPLAPDIMRLLNDHLPDVLQEALPVLAEEGIVL